MMEWASNQRITTPVTYVIRGEYTPPEADESAGKKYKKLGF
jgi:hypothetical protein